MDMIWKWEFVVHYGLNKHYSVKLIFICSACVRVAFAYLVFSNIVAS